MLRNVVIFLKNFLNLLRNLYIFLLLNSLFSFGRGVSHDDDGAHSDYEAAISSDKNHIIVNKNNAAWSNRPVRIQLNADNGKKSLRNRT